MKYPAASAVLVIGALAATMTGARADEAGEAVFKRNCAVCHMTAAGQNRLGPSLAGIVGRKAGTVPGFVYSEANKNSGVTWDEATLDTYLQDPKKFMPGTKMVSPGVKDADARAALIAYLKQQP
jgi:cytochrome c